MGAWKYEVTTCNTARLPRRARGVPAFRPHGANTSFGSAFNTCTPGARVPQEGRGKPQSAWAEAKGKAFRFPQACRLVERRFADLAGQFGIGKALTYNVPYGQTEAVGMGHVLAIVVTERLVIDIAEKMKRVNAYVGTAQPALE